MEIMMNRIAIDTNILIKIIERELIFDDLTLVISSPVLAEFLIFYKTDDERDLVYNTLLSDKQFDFSSFDNLSAIECSKLLTNFDKNTKIVSWQKVKFDFQIVSIAKTNNLSIATTDEQVIKLAKINGVEIKEIIIISQNFLKNFSILLFFMEKK
jgi:predicted nucleic acid-binding protein